MSAIPGPWVIKPLKGKYYGTVVNIGDTHVTVWAPLGMNYSASERELADGWTPDHGFDHVETQQSYATARLIAAAPDLLAALQAIAEGCSFPEDDVQRAVRDRARAAIAKATQP